MTIALMNPAAHSWVFSVDASANPCSCCDAPRAMDHMDGYWFCDQQNKTWLVLDDSFDCSAPHSPMECTGNCSSHSLLDSLMFSMNHAEAFGICWGDIILAEEFAALASETPEERDARLKAEAAKDAARQLAVKASEMERYARLKAQTNTEVIKTDRGKLTRIRKVEEPCKWLYLDEKAPKHEWRRTRDGKLEPPYRPHLTGAECWAYEYHDPKTGKLQIKHTCDRLHPGQEGWQSEWNTNLYWRPAAQETRDFSGFGSSRVPSRCSDAASTVSVASARSHHSSYEAPGAPRKPCHAPPARAYTGKKAPNSFRALAFDDSD